MAQKATHMGTCQCCGSLQKLPGGRLSKHGYTVQWGFFQGTCYGAGHLPFEQSKDLIEGLIAKAQGKAADLRAEAADYMASTDPAVMRSTYEKGTRGRPGYYVWKEDRILEETRTFSDGEKYNVFCWESDKKRAAGFDTETLAGAILKQRKPYEKHLLEQAAQADHYATWQQERIQDWQPGTLQEVEPASTQPKVHLVRMRSLHLENGQIKARIMQGAACSLRDLWNVKQFADFAKAAEETPEACCSKCLQEYQETKAYIDKLKTA